MKNLLILSFCLFITVLSKAQTDSVKLKEFSENLTKIEQKFVDQQNTVLDSLKKLTTELDELKGSKNLLKRVEVIEKKQENIEELDKITESKDVALLNIRYNAGLLVIKDIIEYLKTLKSQYAALNFQQSYNNLSNPNQYNEYTQNISFLKEKLVKSGLNLPDIQLNNAFLNVAYSIARSVVSGQSDKESKINELICILDFTSKASQNLNSINYDLKYLQLVLDKMLINYKELFSNYTSMVGYKGTFEDYISQSNDDVDELIKKYFDSLALIEGSEKDKEIKNLRFQLKKIADSYLEYEIYIRQGLAYYEKFDLIMTDLNPSCSVQNLEITIRSRYSGAKQELITAKASFEEAYKGKIKQSYLKQLSEG